MILIGENLHIISKSVREALLARDEKFVLENIARQAKSLGFVDLNVGPAKADMAGILPWLCKLVENSTDLRISLDTTNKDEMRRGLEACKSPEKNFINSASADFERLEAMTDLAAEFGTNLIALTLSSKSGVPKTADERFELALEIYETCMEKGIDNGRIYFDPLVLPISVEQGQAMEVLNTIKILKESFEPSVNTVIGLSNISNGSPKELRGLINRVFLAMAYGAGLDAAIADAFDAELIDTVKMFKAVAPKTKADRLLLDLGMMIEQFMELDELEVDKNDEKSVEIYKTAQILLNQNIYSHSYLK